MCDLSVQLLGVTPLGMHLHRTRSGSREAAEAQPCDGRFAEVHRRVHSVKRGLARTRKSPNTDAKEAYKDWYT